MVDYKVNQELFNHYTTTFGSHLAAAFVEIENTGNTPLYLHDGQFDEELLDTDEIDLDNFIYQSVTLSFPNKLVCDINCKGNIEIKTEEFIQDPRLEIFNKLKKDN